MKNSIRFYVIIFICITSTTLAQKHDSVSKFTYDSLSNINKRIIDSLKFSPNYIDTSYASGVHIRKADGTFSYTPKHLDALQQCFVLSPIIFFLLILFLVWHQLKKESFKLSDALTENTTIEIEIENPAYKNDKEEIVAGQPQFIKKTITPKSTSRLAILISGLAAVAITTCTTSYYFYMYLKTNTPPQLDGLFNILLTVGIGVIPYSVNRITGAFNNKSN